MLLNMDINGVSEAIKVVGLQALAAHCNVTYQAVRKWERGLIPAERAKQVSHVSGIPLHVLRPDLWDPPGDH